MTQEEMAFFGEEEARIQSLLNNRSPPRLHEIDPRLALGQPPAMDDDEYERHEDKIREDST